MKALEEEANSKGLSYSEMMQHAGEAIANVVHTRYFMADKRNKALGLIGSGNNGGDTLVALTSLQKRGWQTAAWLLKTREESDELIKAYQSIGGKLILMNQDHDCAQLINLSAGSVVLDGILGTGFQLPLKPDVARILKVMGETERHAVVAVDCPSGVDCQTGQAAMECLQADLTVCIASVKTGLLQYPAAGLTGELISVDIGLADNLKAWSHPRDEQLDEKAVRILLPERPKDAHKGTFGTAFIVAGSMNYVGAAFLAGKSAYRVGCGLVKMAVIDSVQNSITGHLPEAVWIRLPQQDGFISPTAVKIIFNNFDSDNAMLVGPGLGNHKNVTNFLELLVARLLKEKITSLVLDADALRQVTCISNWSECLPKQSILTPHPGEMAAMCGMDINDIQTSRVEIARIFAQKWGHVLVLKGAMTVIASPQGEISICPIATPALARAGTGDVLAGVITGFLAQGLLPIHAAKIGVWLHGQAGLIAEQEVGNQASILAGDVLAALPKAVNKLLN
jgi:NAD(P)H-hydrate epimerase